MSIKLSNWFLYIFDFNFNWWHIESWIRLANNQCCWHQPYVVNISHIYFKLITTPNLYCTLCYTANNPAYEWFAGELSYLCWAHIWEHWLALEGVWTSTFICGCGKYLPGKVHFVNRLRAGERYSNASSVFKTKIKTICFFPVPCRWVSSLVPNDIMAL